MRCGLGFVGKKAAPSVDFLTQGNSTPASTSWNFSLNVPSYGRTVLLVLALSIHSAANGATINSCAWNSIAGSALATTGVGIANNYNRISLYAMEIPAGSQGATANVSATASGSAARATFAAWVVKDYTSATPIIAPTDTNSAGTVLALGYGTLLVGDLVISAVHDYRSTDHGWTFSFGTKDYDADLSGGNTIHYAGAHATMTAGGSFTMTVTEDDATNFTYAIGVGAAFR